MYLYLYIPVLRATCCVRVLVAVSDNDNDNFNMFLLLHFSCCIYMVVPFDVVDGRGGPGREAGGSVPDCSLASSAASLPKSTTRKSLPRPLHQPAAFCPDTRQHQTSIRIRPSNESTQSTSASDNQDDSSRSMMVEKMCAIEPAWLAVVSDTR
jgi:hypothetical protein